MIRLTRSFFGFPAQKRSKHFKPSARLTPCIKPHVLPVQEEHCEIPIPCYGGRYMTVMISGIGIGPELMNHVKDIFRYATIPVDFEHIQVNQEKDVDNATMAIKRCGCALKSVMGGADTTSNITIKKNLDIYLSVTHWKPYPGINAKHKDVDMIVISQNIEGEYAMLEHENIKGVVECLKIMTKYNSERVTRRAFEYAKEHGRKKITVVHKANIMKLSDGLFLKMVREVGKEFPDIEQDDVIVDTCCMQLIKDPKQFDVLVMPNLYGLIISHIISGLLGGAGLYAGSSYGQYYAIFEPVSRSLGKKIAGKNIANPVAMLNASVELLHYLKLTDYALLLQNAIFKTITVDRTHTRDLGGTNSSDDVIQKIKENISEMMKIKRPENPRGF